MTTLQTHAHRWVLPPPSGPIVIGKCSCGATRAWGTSEESIRELTGKRAKYPTGATFRKWSMR